VVWHIFHFSVYIGNVIIPTDELHHFSEGLVNQPPTGAFFSLLWDDWDGMTGAVTTLSRYELPGLVNIQKAIEHGHRNSGFSH